jgi:two-component system sensor histidine kinase TctE
MGVDLGVRGADRPVEVFGQTSLVDGILDNLIDNSLRYGKLAAVGTSTITIAIECDCDSRVVLMVVDNGQGINRADWDRVIERWSKGPIASSLRIGTGLGLYLVAEYCRILKADLTLDPSTPDQGTTIRITFAPTTSALSAD